MRNDLSVLRNVPWILVRGDRSNIDEHFLDARFCASAGNYDAFELYSAATLVSIGMLSITVFTGLLLDSGCGGSMKRSSY